MDGLFLRGDLLIVLEQNRPREEPERPRMGSWKEPRIRRECRWRAWCPAYAQRCRSVDRVDEAGPDVGGAARGCRKPVRRIPSARRGSASDCWPLCNRPAQRHRLPRFGSRDSQPPGGRGPKQSIPSWKMLLVEVCRGGPGNWLRGPRARPRAWSKLRRAAARRTSPAGRAGSLEGLKVKGRPWATRCTASFSWSRSNLEARPRRVCLPCGPGS